MIIMKKKDGEYDVNFLKILILCDKNGYILLYCVVEGGFVDIFKVLIKVMEEINKCVEMKDKIKIDDIIYNGWLVLYFVCMNKYCFLCRYLLIDDGYKKFFFYKILV